MNLRESLALSLGLLVVALWPVRAAAQAAGALSERDWFEELPVVLSVSRLAQPLDEAPGAVTVIDRETIRRSGAREVAEVLRLVPGFVFTTVQGGPLAAYHAGMDTVGARMQVYVDGRSLYSTYYLGDTHLGLRGLVLEDIDRIEVLRGSNSAAYGANAFLGVVNIVTRNSADTHGAMLSMTGGDKGVNDNVARLGWGDATASFRITASRRDDHGLDTLFDDSNLSRFQLRGDLNPTADDSLMLQVGTGEITYGEGTGSSGNPLRPVSVADANLHASWQHRIAPDENLQLRLAHDRERFDDSFVAVAAPFSAVVSTKGTGQRTEFGFQHQKSLGRALRGVWGIEMRREEVRSAALFSSGDSVAAQQRRFFGNVEWRLAEKWVLHGGAMYERHSITGGHWSPRLAANYHVAPGHTLRYAATKSYRSPTLFDLRGERRYIDQATGVIVPVIGRPFLATGTVRPESLVSREIGYLGGIRAWRLTADVRAFDERMNDRLWYAGRTVGTFTNVADAVNAPGPRLHGIEYQLVWEPVAGSKLMLAETHMREKRGDARESLEAPFASTTWAWFQNLPGGLEASLISTASTPFQWAGTGELIDTPRRLDFRLGQPFKIGATRGEWSVTTLALNGGHQEYKRNLRFNRRTHATLRFDF